MPGGFVLLPTVALQWEDGLTLVLIWGQWALEVGQASHKGW